MNRNTLSEIGPLPTFLIGGAPKAGTTALYEYVRQHPDVFMSTPKETGFFHKDYREGKDWFRSHFSDWEGEEAIGEASVMTMSTPGAEERVAKLIPDARLIFLLRDPVDRAYSDYLFNVQQGWIPPDVSFHDLIRNDVDVKDYSGGAVIERGLYLKHLRRFREHFDRSQMQVLLSKELKNDTDRVLRSVFSFIGVGEAFSPDDTEKHNVTRYMAHGRMYRLLRAAWQPLKTYLEKVEAIEKARSKIRSFFFRREDKPSMRPEDRAYLHDVYRQPNQQLAEWLERDLSHWN